MLCVLCVVSYPWTGITQFCFAMAQPSQSQPQCVQSLVSLYMYSLPQYTSRLVPGHPFSSATQRRSLALSPGGGAEVACDFAALTGLAGCAAVGDALLDLGEDS